MVFNMVTVTESVTVIKFEIFFNIALHNAHLTDKATYLIFQLVQNYDFFANFSFPRGVAAKVRPARFNYMFVLV